MLHVQCLILISRFKDSADNRSYVDIGDPDQVEIIRLFFTFRFPSWKRLMSRKNISIIPLRNLLNHEANKYIALINWIPTHLSPHLQRTASTLPANIMPTADLHNDMEYYIEPLIFQVPPSDWSWSVAHEQMQVEDTLYRIPREYLSQESTIIRDMLQIPQSMNSDSEGSTDSKPIIVQQIKATSFRFLLQFFFNLDG